MAIRKATLKSEKGMAPRVVEAIKAFALHEDIENVTVYHIAGDILTLRCPAEHFDRLTRLPGIVEVENSFTIVPSPTMPAKPPKFKF